MKHEVRYRIDVDYLSVDYEDACLNTSRPIYTKAGGMKEYRKAIKERCVDDCTKSARVHLWKYNYINGKFAPITIAKNY